MKYFAILLLTTLTYLALTAQDIVIKNINVIDVNKGTVNMSKDILIEDGIISTIRSSDKKKYPNTIDGKGKYLIPGLIDAHIHLFQSGGLYTRPDAFDARTLQPYEEERQWLIDNAEQILSRYLSQGITSVIDVGGPMYQFALRDSLNLKSNTARLYLTGPLISTYLPNALDVDMPPIIKVITPRFATRLVGEQAKAGADFIKIWYIADRPQDALDKYHIIEAAIKEADAHDLLVAVHATNIATAKLALKAGADFLVHSIDDSKIDEEFISMLKSSGAVYCPTLEVSKNYNRVFFDEYDFTTKDFEIAPPIPLGTLMDVRHLKGVEDLKYYLKYENALKERDEVKYLMRKENLKIVSDAQLPIAVGSDAGNIGTMHASSFFKELTVMKASGMSDASILKSATLTAAQAIGKDSEIGSVDINKIADLVILAHNPLDDIQALESIDIIIKNGQVIEPETVVVSSPEQLVQTQLNGYNGHDLSAFLTAYADDVKIYDFPRTLTLDGKKEMMNKYAWIEETPDLHCELVNRIVNGNVVIDHERVIFEKTKPPLEVIAVYKIAHGKIAEVTFIR